MGHVLDLQYGCLQCHCRRTAVRWPVQVYSEVLPLLPDVQYNAPARILTLRASGSRKQPRLPGGIQAPPASGSTCCTATVCTSQLIDLCYRAFAPAVPILIYRCGN